MVRQKLCQNSLAGWGSLEESNLFIFFVLRWRPKTCPVMHHQLGVGGELVGLTSTGWSGQHIPKIFHREWESHRIEHKQSLDRRKHIVGAYSHYKVKKTVSDGQIPHDIIPSAGVSQYRYLKKQHNLSTYPYIFAGSKPIHVYCRTSLIKLMSIVSRYVHSFITGQLSPIDRVG
jgi:hypothetical protein